MQQLKEQKRGVLFVVRRRKKKKIWLHVGKVVRMCRSDDE